MGQLEGKVVLITGGGNGIGRAAVELFASEGAKVVVGEVQEEAGAAAAKAVVDAGGKAIFVRTDVTVPENAEAAVAAAISNFGKLDVLYNNAGRSFENDATVDGDIDVFWKTIQLNLFGTWLMSRFAIPRLIENGGGAIVNTASIAGLVGLRKIDAYSASKGGIIALTRSLALQYAEHRIRVNAVAPTKTLTPRAAKLDDERPTGGGDRNHLGHAMPIDIARGALFLASENASRITGHTLPVDSGFTST